MADSKPATAATWTTLLSKYGYRPTLDELEAAVGIRFVDTHARYAQPAHGVRTATRSRHHLPRVASALLHPLPDGTELARAFGDRGLPVAIASSSARRRLDATLRLLELQTLFSDVAGDEVTRSKPEPEAYLRATQLLGTPPWQCLAVEDSPAGPLPARLE